jgi:hypothetical protein
MEECFLLSVTMLNVIMSNVIMVNVIMVIVIMVNVIMFNVVVPFFCKLRSKFLATFTANVLKIP